MERKTSAPLLRTPTLLRILMIIGVVAFISLLFPNNLRFKYEFERGQTWRYDDLRAPFDFAVLKPADELKRERSELLATLTPIYTIIDTVAAHEVSAFSKAFRYELEQIQQTGDFGDVTARPNRYLDYGRAFLSRTYERGVTELLPEHSKQRKDFVISIRRGNELREETRQNLLTVAQVKELLSDSLLRSGLREPEFLYPILDHHIRANLLYNDSLTTLLREEALATVPSSQGVVNEDDLIIANGGVITDEVYQQLLSFQQQYEERIAAQHSYFGVFLGFCLLTALVVSLYVLYLRYYAPLVYGRFHRIVFLMLWLVVFSYLVYVVENTLVLSTYLIPFGIVPIVVEIFFDKRLAFFTHIVNVLIASFLTSLGYEFTFLQIIAGIIVLLNEVDTRDWTSFFNSLLYIFLGYALGYIGLSLIEEGSLAQIDYSVLLWLGLNVFLTLLAYPLIPLLERLFGFVSPITLTELNDMNRPLLRELAMKAPGTFQHSLQVANMSEQAARRVGADHLLVKTGALYHDIGKVHNPKYFIENQSGKNPHEDVSILESAQIIIGHVTEGVQMAKKNGLPPVLVDFIRSHHGTTRAEYFYRNYLQEHPDEEVDESLFRYPGPRPATKEETILMLADSVEAACKSLKNPTEEDLYETIDKIIDGKVASAQLEDSQLSFRELEDCRHVFRNYMKSVHHTRIEYPEDKQPANATTNGPRSGSEVEEGEA